MVARVGNQLYNLLLYTSFPPDVFEVLVNMVNRMSPFNYFSGWTVSCFTIEDQLLMTFMKLRVNCIQGSATSLKPMALALPEMLAPPTWLNFQFLYAEHQQSIQNCRLPEGVIT
ncbi:hypothetical protein DPMN_185932 [Dreissena polymorpha]|uniref:Uncharacterized protein n=1 Tax=Dreissena polymorpha TaxID=45954 RepID=A0A9D4DLT9_DREPO|nr:hypothetical protein DPMN_185932 [Dreissena polymorpha]